MSKPAVFLSYSHQDEAWKDRLVKHLTVLEREGLLAVWHDRRIGAGAEWYPEIQTAIERADVALLLVSADFLNSPFIQGEEIPPLLKRRQENGLPVIPVIVKDCPWRHVPWLAGLNARPADGKSLEALPTKRLNGALSKIAEEVLTFLHSPAGDGPSLDFLRLYRQRLSHTFSRWDLAHVGVVQTGGAGRPIEATLDDMYLPLRLGKKRAPAKTTSGAPVTPEDLLTRSRPLVVRGPAGSGKTTWMRWTFRRLVEREDAFPVMLVLRDLARRWQDPAGCHGTARALDTFLESWIADRLGGDYRPIEVHRALGATSGPRPVLLIDGWDETGDLGRELREKLLGLHRRHPRILIVVTSRPYGEGRPSRSEGFDLLEIQPLSAADIDTLTGRFFTRCYGEDLAQVDSAAVRFRKALDRSPEARAMARTALLLTMMLLISRTQPLPDKRHQLYEACIENLLTAPREREGALLLPEQWRPEDRDERLRVVAALAFGAQVQSYGDRDRRAIVRTWDELAALLPDGWLAGRRAGFLAWLAGPAGLLTDQADGTLTFTHLSFQEYLAAWFLNSTLEGSDRITEFQRHGEVIDWWETLRLWAALIERANPARLDSVLGALLDRHEILAYGLAGTILADGMGRQDRFRAWLAEWPSYLSWAASSAANLCAQAWSATRQEGRRSELIQQIGEAAGRQTWLGWVRCREFNAEVGFQGEIPRPKERLAASVIAALYDEAPPTMSSVAAARILSGGPPLWPPEPPELGLLQVWPGRRRILGQRLQLAACCGASSGDLRRLIRSRFALQSLRDDGPNNLALSLARDWASKLGREWVRDSGRDLARNWACYWIFKVPLTESRELAPWHLGWAMYLGFGSSVKSTRAWALRWVHDATAASFGSLANDWATELARELAVARPPHWLEEFAWIEPNSAGRALPRVELAWRRAVSVEPTVALLSVACRRSLHPQDYLQDLDQALASYPRTSDPLWPALARHLARCANGRDRALLTGLAQHPERREPPLSWGLQFIVRGDVLLDDGSVMLLDDLTDQAGLSRLPYLEVLPDELEVDWGDE
jgi:TIR domain/NACHT domain